MNCLIIAGEKSGEEHCLTFFSGLRANFPQMTFWGVGGDELAAQGMELQYHLRDFSSWGFSGVIGKVPFYLKALKQIEREVLRRNCKVAILIDFQDFNLRLAKKLKRHGVAVLYYVAPQAWVWKAYRAKVLAQVVHTLFTIIPFEKKWFKDRGVQKVVSVAHPSSVRYEIDGRARSFENFDQGIKLLLLPGSRNFEVENLLPQFIKAASALKARTNVTISLVRSSNVFDKYYAPYLSHVDRIYQNETLVEALREADFCLAASGTVTLICALFRVPTVVCYKISWLNWIIFKLFIRYNGFVSLANIVHNKLLFPELIQQQMNVGEMIEAIECWRLDKVAYERLEQQLSQTRQLLVGDNVSVSDYISDVIREVYEEKVV